MSFNLYAYTVEKKKKEMEAASPCLWFLPATGQRPYFILAREPFPDAAIEPAECGVSELDV